MNFTKQIKDKGYEIGFDLIGIAPAHDYPDSQYYKEWLNKNYEASMLYMSRNMEKRENVKNLMKNAKSVICCGLNYNTDYPYSTESRDKSKGWIARYAWGDDYHFLVKEKLSKLEEYIRSSSSSSEQIISYVDTGPVLERMYARYSGIGWLGKNTCIINQEIGSWFFLGEIITSMELEYDTPAIDRCGTCTACIDQCPTDALREPYILDSNRCVSFFTIENKDKIPINYREDIENNIFGCDICQDVCPWNTKAEITNKEQFQPRERLFNPELKNLVSLTQNEFSDLFKDSPIKRAKRKGFLRNVLTAIGNSGEKKFLPFVEKNLDDEEPLIRSHAIWAYWKLKGRDSYKKMSDLFEQETDSNVLKEIEYVMSIVKEG